MSMNKKNFIFLNLCLLNAALECVSQCFDYQKCRTFHSVFYLPMQKENPVYKPFDSVTCEYKQTRPKQLTTDLLFNTKAARYMYVKTHKITLS